MADKEELVTFGGKRELLSKENYFKFLGHNLDDYQDIELTPEESARLSRHMQKLTTGATAVIPLLCAGSLCPFATRCPLMAIQKAPIGKQCPLEVEVIREWTMRYFEEFDVDPNNFTEVGYVAELAELMLLEQRINFNLSKPENGNLTINQTMGVDRDGDPIVQTVVSPFIEMKEKIAGRRSRIIKLMVGDRQEKYKKEAALKIKLSDDPSKQMADLRAKLESLKRELDTVGVPDKKKILNVLSPEDIIDGT